MILQSSLLVLAASVLQVATPESATASVLPPDCGLTDEQVLVMAVPKYHELLARSNRHDPQSAFEDHFDASVVATVKTDLGFAGRSFLIAAISAQSGSCDACYDATVIAIDLRSKLLVWRSDSKSGKCYIAPSTFPESDEPILRVFYLFPGDPVRTLAFRFGSEDPFHGERATDERWLRPSLAANGSLTLDTIWEANIRFSTSGVASFTWPQEVTSTMQSLWPRRAYKRTRHISAEFGAGGQAAFTIQQEFTEDLQSQRLIPGAEKISREDRERASIFPFNLRMSAVVLDRGLLPESERDDRVKAAVSPMGNLSADRVEGTSGKHQHLRICRVAGGTPIRDVWSGLTGSMPRGWDIEDGLDFRSVGWTSDGRRCLAIVELGLLDIPPVLVSLTPHGPSDRWEGLLPEGYALPDGFILDLPETSRKPNDTAMKHQ